MGAIVIALLIYFLLGVLVAHLVRYYCSKILPAKKTV